jgi:ubiquinone/menaquinone biosynthesis C-methylase UbiE
LESRQQQSQPTDWSVRPLPRTWADAIDLATPSGVMLLLSGAWRSLWRRSRPLEVPAELPGRDRLPNYLLHEFHGMPNGYYSEKLVASYARGFEAVMLGKMGQARARIAQRLQGADRVLDVGCGAGHLAAELQRGGASEVWGLDPCPYALKLGHRELPHVKFVQGLAEDTGFPSRSLDGAGACFVFHELPEAVADQSLRELHRVLVPGALLAITEPSPLHLKTSVWRLLLQGKWLGPYFKALGRMVYEPYLRDWLAREPKEWFARHGFELIHDDVGVPFRELVARRR